MFKFILTLGAALMLPVAANAVDCSYALPDWAKSQQMCAAEGGDVCCVVVDGGGNWGDIEFKATRGGGGTSQLHTPFRAAKCLNKPCNRMYFEGNFDNYEGRAIGVGNCVNDPNCCGGDGSPQGANDGCVALGWKSDGFEHTEINEFETNNLGGRHYFLKNAIFQNGFTYTGNSNPHHDLFQTLAIPYQADPNGSWLVIQDVTFRNSDQQLFHTEMNQIGVVLQNVTLELQTGFEDDCNDRRTEYGHYSGYPSTCECSNGCINSISCGTNDSCVAWSIGLNGNKANRVFVRDGVSDAIIIGTEVWQYSGFTGTKHYYDTIDDALEDTTNNWDRPPFIHLSDVGWRDTDSDGVPDFRDNCVTQSNPEQATCPSGRTCTGGQLDDDADGYGNACDGDFSNSGSTVGGIDTPYYTNAIGKAVSASTCQPGGTTSCAMYDLSESGSTIGGVDTTIYNNTLLGSTKDDPNGPWLKCPDCPLACEGPACP